MSVDVSVIICTRDRAQDLQETLAAMARVNVPEGLSVELLVVDNGSLDNTKEVTRGHAPSNMAVRYVYEHRRGKGYAYNAGIAASQGAVLLFTDDDVRPPRNWIEGMCEPILSGRAHAVAGGVKIAGHLERQWMEPIHRAVLASTEYLDPEHPREMVGANMAFSKAVLDKVPHFDTELGPGALGFCEDTLFASQLVEAGYSIVSAFDVAVEHHPDQSRLHKAAYIERAKKQGRSWAYIRYHWKHETIPAPRRQLLKYALYLLYLRVKKRGEWSAPEGCPEWEMSMVEAIYFYKQYLRERGRPHKYEVRGLLKTTGHKPVA